MNEYSKSELILLKYANGFNVNAKFPNVFTNVHELSVEETIQTFLSDGMLEIAPIAYSLGKYTVSELKAFLMDNGKPAKGKKEVIIQSIIADCNPKEIETHFSERYYVLTEKGKRLLEEQLSEDDFRDRFEPILKGFSEAYEYIKAKEYEKSKKLLMSVGHNCVSNHSENQAYEEFYAFKIDVPQGIDEKSYKAYVILYHLYGVRAESAAKDFKKKAGVDVSVSKMRTDIKIIRSLDQLISVKCIDAKMKKSSLGYQEYSIKSCNDERVCEYCQKMNGKHLKLEKAVIGINFPPFNKCTCDSCRCFAITTMTERKTIWNLFKRKK